MFRFSLSFEEMRKFFESQIQKNKETDWRLEKIEKSLVKMNEVTEELLNN